MYLPTIHAVLFVALLCLPRFASAEESTATDKSDVLSQQQRELFTERVLPIFETRCVSCHNDNESEGGLSVQSAESVLAFIQRGDANRSRFAEVISLLDGEAEMPKDSDPLQPTEISAIRQWIAVGAPWPNGTIVRNAVVSDFDWWSLRPLVRPDLPPATHSFNHPIDRFLQVELDRHQLRPVPPADRRVLVRRLYFDLLGLPPTTAQIREFLEDTTPDAYETLVDRLLESPHYGERWARHWLDVVHYADTHGYDKDKIRDHAWPYRDYVIRSLNDDKPYSKFIKEQIAGDVLWPHTRDGITATGFIAAGPWDYIGHAEVPETKIDGRIARNLDRDDMVSSTMNTFISTTVQCARCHNHKFDAITQRQYYSLQAVFAALDRADRPFDFDSTIAQQRQRLKQQLTATATKQSQTDERIQEFGGKSLQELESRIATLADSIVQTDLKHHGYHSELTDHPTQAKWIQIDLGQPAAIERIEVVGAHDNFANIGAGFGFPLRYRVDISNDPDFDTDVINLVDQTDRDVANPGTTPVQLSSLKARRRYLRMTATHLFRRDDAYIFAIGELRVLDATGQNLALNARVTALDSIQAPPRWDRQNLVDDRYVGKGHGKDARTLADLIQQRDKLLNDKVPSALRSRKAALQTEAQRLRQAVSALPEPGMVYAGTIHHGSGAFRGTGANEGLPRPIHVLHRGDVLQPGELVEPGRIAISTEDDWQFSLPREHKEGARRVALANWIADPQNPLTWRSIVNRIWQYHFGQGIVATPNDFGRMGASPSHPQLLDWLAVEFRDGGQSWKQLHRLIVTSQAYRRSSEFEAQNAKIDGQNRFLWRMNRRRLSAEEIRDAVLTVSGKLQTKLYGPSVQLFVVQRPEHSPHYEYGQHDPYDPASHRRSIYRCIVRSQPDPFMTTLDCADSSQSVPTRIETVTPLQALSLLNNPFMLAMAEESAETFRSQTDSLDEQVTFAFAETIGRSPTVEEIEPLQKHAHEFGLANTCRVLFNLNEFVFVD